MQGKSKSNLSQNLKNPDLLKWMEVTKLQHKWKLAEETPEEQDL